MVPKKETRCGDGKLVVGSLMRTLKGEPSMAMKSKH